MPYTRHGHWYGDNHPTSPPLGAVARCGGPALCPACALDAQRSGGASPVQHQYTITRGRQYELDEDTTDHDPAPVTAPTVGRIVHYTSYGTPNGEYTSVCRAAIITEVHPRHPGELGMPDVALTVLNPTGIFFNPHCNHSDEDDEDGEHHGGTWHWPERA